MSETYGMILERKFNNGELTHEETAKFIVVRDFLKTPEAAALDGEALTRQIRKLIA